MGCIVIPGPAYATPIPVTISDTVDNLRMDSIAAGFLHNRSSTTAAVVAIAHRSAPDPETFTIAAGGSLQLSPHVLRVMETDTTLGDPADLVALF
jgi:hypothetical protein